MHADPDLAESGIPLNGLDLREPLGVVRPNLSH